MSRARNIGINFKPDSSGLVPSYAKIYSASSIAYGIEFWLKIDDLQNTYNVMTPNLIFNGDFEISAASGWTLFLQGTNSGIVTNPSYSGSSLWIGGTISPEIELDAIGASIAVSPGDIFYSEIWKRYSSASGREMEYFTIYDSLGNVLGYKNLFIVNQASAVLQNQWIKYTESFAITYSNAAYIVPVISLRNYATEGPGFSGSAYFDNFVLRKQPNNIYLLNTSSYSLYYTASNPVLRFASAAQMFVYINGASVSNSSYKLSNNEYYHIAISHNSSVSGNIYLNGGVSNSGSYNANATYGHLAIWNTQPSQIDIQNRYNLFIKNQINVASARDTNTFIYNTSYSENVYTIESGN